MAWPAETVRAIAPARRRGVSDMDIRIQQVRRTKDEGRRTKDGGRRTKDEGRRTKDEGRGTRDEGRRRRDEGRGTKALPHLAGADLLPSTLVLRPYLLSSCPVRRSNSQVSGLPMIQRFREAADHFRMRWRGRSDKSEVVAVLDGSLEEYRETYAKVTGKSLENATVFEIGYGARPLRLMWLLSHGID